MKNITLLTPALLLIGCGSSPVPQQTQQQVPATQQQFQSNNSAPPVVAQQPYPSSPEGAPVQQQAQPGYSEQPSQPESRGPQQAEIAIPGGTEIHVRLNQTLDTRRNRAGDRFTASLAEPVAEGGRVVVPRGTIFTGHVTNSKPSGRLKGRAMMGLTLDSFEINGARHPVVTSRTGRVSAAHKKRNLVLIGGGSGVGALIGGLAGGGRGALIGAGGGAGAGMVGAAVTGKKEVTLPAETLLTFRLEENVEM